MASSNAPVPHPPPNYYLIGIGCLFLLGIIGMYILQPVSFPPIAQALLISLAMTLTLYGMLPPAKIAGTFGKLRATGPAALGVFLFGIILHNLTASDNQDFMLIEKTPTPKKLTERNFPGGATVKLLTISSLPKKNLHRKFLLWTQAIERDGGVSGKKTEELLREFYPRIINASLFNDKQKRTAIDLFSQREDKKKLNDAWKELVSNFVDEGENPDLDERNIKNETFAIVKVHDNTGVNIRLIIAGAALRVNGIDYAVPAMANRHTGNDGRLQEVLVIQMKKHL